MRLLPALMLLAACADSSSTAAPPGADLSATAGADLAVAGADLATHDAAAPGGDAGACLAGSTPPTTLYLDYCMDAPSSFCFHDTPSDVPF